MTAHPSILLIEDSPGECELFRAAVKESGVAVSLQTGSTTEEAFRFLAQADGIAPLPSLILLDLKLGNSAVSICCGDSGATRGQGIYPSSSLPRPTTLPTSPPVMPGANGYVMKPGYL